MTKRIRGWAGAACLALMAGTAAGQEGPRLGRFVVPEYTEEGVKKSELTGESARVLAGGVVEVSTFTITFYETGTTNVRMKVSAPHCTYNRSSQFARSPSEVTIKGDNMVVTGENFAWDGAREIFRILQNAKVVLNNVRDRTPAGRPEKNGDADDT